MTSEGSPEIVLRGDSETTSRLREDLRGIGIRDEVIREDTREGGDA